MEKKRLLELLKSEPNKVDAIGMILSNYTDFGHTEKGGMVSVAQFKKVAECILEWSESQKAETSDKPSINYKPLLSVVDLRKKLLTMRFLEQDVKDMEEGNRLANYGFTECIKEVLAFIDKDNNA